MASSSTSTEEEQDKPTYPYPVGVNVQDYVHDLLSGSNYQQWKQQMENLIKEKEMIGFIDGTTKAPARKVIVDGREIENKEHESWKKSNDLVRKWIRDTITDDIKTEVKRFWTAKGLWTRLNILYDAASRFLPLHKAAIEGNWDEASKFIEKESDAVRVGITKYSETALIVAVKSKKRNHFVKHLLKKMSEKDLALGDTGKRTALHRAAGAGNIEAAKLLVNKNPYLPNAQTYYKRIPLFFAAARGHREMVLYLLNVTTDEARPTSSTTCLSQLLSANGFSPRSKNQTPIGSDDGTKMGIEKYSWNPTPFDGESGFRILHQLTINGFYDIALALLQDKPQMALFIPETKKKGTEKKEIDDIEFHPLVALARKPSSFKSGTSFNWLQSCIYWVLVKLEKNADHRSTGDIENPAGCFTSSGGYAKKILHWMIWKITYLCKHIKEQNRLHDQARKLVKFLCNELANSNDSNVHTIFEQALFQATSLGIVEIVEDILRSYPDAIHIQNETGQSIFHQAIVCRHENVFNLIHQVGESKTIFLSQLDKSKNNALHLAGKLAPQQQLYRKAGAALQMQRELQWFEEVEKHVVPRNKEERNDKNKTPAEVFTDTHKNLVKEGERWMKDTANGCIIAATLIATVVFAAAITVPGGNNSDGNPLFYKQAWFIIFGISDAFALFSSVTSVLFFMSILTARYGEHDFLVTLPVTLIFGLLTLFLCILSTMIAFGATLYLVFGRERHKAWITIPIPVFACMPVALFVSLKLPLLADMIKSTSGSIFVKRKDDAMLH